MALRPPAVLPRLALALLLLFGARAALAGEPLTVGVLKFGTVNWQLAALKQAGLDRAAGFQLEVLPLASKNATSVALMAGEADVIVSDWIWALRQRNAGEDFLFAPYSTALGAVVVAADGPVQSIVDLAGRRLGVAGGPLDKSWLILQAWARQTAGFDVAAAAEVVFAAPPLLAEQLRAGRLDAVLIYWPYAARLEAAGHRRLIGVDQTLRDLGIGRPQALVGYLFRERLVRERPEAIDAFLKAIAETNRILAGSEAAWQDLAPLMKAAGPAEFESLKAGYRAGIPAPLEAASIDDAHKLYDLLLHQGGAELLGDKPRFDAALFWRGP